MMRPRKYSTFVVASAIGIFALVSDSAFAVDRFWQGDVSNVYANTAGGNWSSGVVPRASVQERAVIGTDDPAGALNSDSAPFGSPVMTASVAAPGGIALGIRRIDYDDADFDGNTTEFLFETAPAAGALLGRLNIGTGGSVTSISTGSANVGADGRLLVGVDGRGYLTMTGGSLTATAVIVAGETFDDVNGSSMVSLSGSSSFQIDNTNPVDGTAVFGRRLRVEGPNVNFRTDGRLTLQPSNTYTAVITSSTAHSPLKTDGTAIVGGSLFVEFSGAGATHSPGQTWNLVEAGAGIGDSTFSNLLTGGDVQVSGVPTPDAGLAYRLKRTSAGPTSILQLSYERLLVLNVNRTTGELSITNPHGGPISIDSYTIGSDLGSLVTSYHGISGTTPSPPSPNWQKYGLSANDLTEVINNPSDPDQVFNLTSVPTVALGTGFDRDAVASNVANFGTDGEDLEFFYSTRDGAIVRGHVVYGNGTKFENNLVLRVNPNTGVARLKNDSLETLVFDGFDITSTNSALSGAGFTAITGGTGTWQTDVEGTTGLSQVNFGGARTLAPGQEVSIGDISSLVDPFDTQAEQDGLSMRFILAEGLESSAATGDYNNDGMVDAVDYTVWRNNFGLAATNLENRDPANMAATVDGTHYTDWKANYGSTGGLVPETEFRIGSIFFDASLAGAGSGGLAIPEPASGAMLLIGFGALFAGLGRRRQSSTIHTYEQPTHTEHGQLGVRIMVRRIAACVLAMAVFGVTVAETRPVVAATGGIPITNFDFELPGPTGEKVVAFDGTGAPILGAIPGWTFTGGAGGVGEVNGLANEDFGDGVLGDSGTEGGGNPGNEMILSTNDGKAYAIAPGHSIINPMANQQYKIGFDARDIFTIDAMNAGVTGGFQLTARLFAGAYPGTTITSQAVTPTGTSTHFEFLIPNNSGLLTGKIGQSLGIEFDTTSREFNAAVAKSWAGIDNVVFEISGILPGDLNGDGVVNLTDAANLVPNLQASTPFEAMGELTGDNVVNLNDFRALKTLIAAGSGSGSGGLAGGPSVPEPGFAALTMISLLLVGAFSGRWRMKFGIHSLAGAIAALFTVLASTSQAELLGYEPFNIPPYSAAALPGQGSGTPFFTGAWSGAATQVVQAGSLSYLGAPSEGGRMVATGEGRSGIFLTNPWTDTTVGTFYLSFLANFGSVTNPLTANAGDMGFRTIEFWPVGNVIGQDANRSEVGFQGFGPASAPPQVARAGWVPGGGNFGRQNLSDLPFVDFGGTHLVVLKYVLSDQPNMDSISVFLDPTSTLEPEVPTASATGLTYTLGAISSMSFFGSDSVPPIAPAFDEFRVATTYFEALPELPLPGDTDGDGDVDLVDYNNIVSNMNQSVDSALMGDVARADGKQGSDGRVTIADYRLWRDNYPTNFIPPGSGNGGLAGVPEPSSGLLAFVAMAFVSLSRARRPIARTVGK